MHQMIIQHLIFPLEMFPSWHIYTRSQEKMRSYRCRIWGIFQLLTSKCKYYKSTILPFPSTKVMQNASEVEDIQLFLRAQHMCNNSNWVKYGLLPLYKCEKVIWPVMQQQYAAQNRLDLNIRHNFFYQRWYFQLLSRSIFY